MAAKKPRKKAGRGRERPAPRREPALGNDPFERGAAVRPATTVPLRLGLTATPAPTPAPTSTIATPIAAPTASPARGPTPLPASTERAPAQVSAIRSRLDALEHRVESATSSAVSAAARLRDLALAEADGRLGRDLAQAVAALAPMVRARVEGLAALRALLWGAPPGPLDPYGMDPALLDRAGPALDFLYATWWRVEVRQLENLPPSGPVIVVANHGGALPWDAIVLRLAALRQHARRDVRPLLDDHALATPLFGRIATRLGAVRASPDHALALLAGGGALGVFPEGSRTGGRPWPERYRLDRFGRGGFARVALRAGAVVVPCAIVGSEETSAPFARPGWLAERLGMPFLGATPSLPLAALGIVPLPSRWSLRFGAPIAAEGGDAAAADQAQVLALTERTRSALQGMLDEDVAARRSVYL